VNHAERLIFSCAGFRFLPAFQKAGNCPSSLVADRDPLDVAEGDLVARVVEELVDAAGAGQHSRSNSDQA
jgi:hypothetical protein